MRAIDTNVVVRIVTNDDVNQVQRASAALAAGDTYLPLTVCLETEWVLRSGYCLEAANIAEHLADFAGLPGVQVEDPEVLAQAIEWLREGMDFSDAMHLASANGCEAMLSFDADFAKAALRLDAMPVIAP